MKTAIVLALIAMPTVALAHAEPDAVGPFAVQVDEYGFGDAAFFPTSLPSAVELTGIIHSPVDLDAGPFPIVVVLHGRHGTCYDPDGSNGDPFENVSQEWPCGSDHEPIPSYLGYGYWAAQLASHGYVVVSIGANGINAADGEAEDGGSQARAELIEAHLELWQGFNDTPEYGTEFNDAVDLQNVGLVGHSRGGEGVAAFVVRNATRAEPFGLGGALLLAPTDFTRTLVADVPLAVILPYCDGDVLDLQGAHYFDDSRHAKGGDMAPKYVFTMDRSNHNFYNTVWSPGTYPLGGAFDDFEIPEIVFEQLDSHCSVAAGGPRLGETEQQASFVAYASAFFRTHLGHETEYVDMLRGDDEPPRAAAAADVRTSYLPPDDPASRLIVNSVATSSSMQTNDLGGAVEGPGLSTYDLCGIGPGGGVENYQHCVVSPNFFMGELYEGREPHVPGLAHLGLAFAGESSWTNALPEGTDVSALLYLQFRAAVDFEDPAASAEAVDFTIALTDRAGVRATTTLQTWTDALARPPGDLYPVAPKLLLHGMRIPLAAFVDPALGGDPALDLADLASVELVFDAGTGALLVSDLAFVDAVPPPMGGTDTSGSDTGDPDTSGSADTSADVGDDTTTSAAAADDTSTDATGGTTGPTATGDGDDGCGCRSSSGGSRWSGWWLAAAALTRRRRRAVLSSPPTATHASPCESPPPRARGSACRRS